MDGNTASNDRFVLHNADCLEAMKGMAADSVDAIVTDPPYALTGTSGTGGFMGAKWDSELPTVEMWKEALRVAKPGAHLLAFGGTRTYHRLACAIEDAGWEVRDCIMWVYGCLSEDTEIATPQGWRKRGEIKRGDKVIAFDIAHGKTIPQEVQRVFDYEYDDKAYRLVSPLTDHLVSKNHRVLAEVNGVLDFVYAEFLRENDTVRVPIYGIDAHLSEAGVLGCHKMTTARVVVTHYRGRMWCVSVPSGAIVARRNGNVFVTGNSGFPKSMDVSKAIDKAMGAERSIVGYPSNGVGSPSAMLNHGHDDRTGHANGDGKTFAITAPATPEAASFSGWGTQTKPACEPVVIAVKPYDGDIEKAINHLKSMEDKICSLNVNDVGKSSTLSQAVSSGVKADSAPASVPTPQGEEKERLTATGKVDDTSSEAATSALAPETESIVLNTILLWRRTLEDAYAMTNKFTTSMVSSLTTDLKTWSCFLLQTTLVDIVDLVTHQSKLNASALLAENYFSAISAKLNTIRTLTVAENAISQNEISPHLSPIVIARKPLEGTVAANVLKYGTGAINIDGCRVPTEDNLNGGAYSKPHDTKRTDGYRYQIGGGGTYKQPLGRFPANLIHDGSEEVLALFPDSKGQCGAVKGTEPSRTGTNGIYGNYNGQNTMLPRGDTGSAARFFYCAKASRSERGEGNIHPTVKPLALMRYLVRLVTRKGGIVLDPFMGSGTTGVAAIQEGMNFVGMEREPHYYEIAQRRISQANTIEQNPKDMQMELPL